MWKFSTEKPTDFYATNTDVSSIRVVLAEATQHPDYGISSMDVATAFLNAPMPTQESEIVYVKPPALLEQFHSIKPGTWGELTKAVYGLRVSPRLWGIERDKQLGQMRFRIKHRVLKAMQSSIDVALWVIVENKECDFDHERKLTDIY